MTMQTFPNGYPNEPESSKRTGTDEWHDRAARADLEQRLSTLIADIKSIHKPVDGGEHGPDECWEDVENWPCRTIQAVRKAEA